MKLKLKRLLLQGFKSFKDRTVVQFDEGITGIVGPNGCGKSNIVDALFWVMGEQSAKHLRGKSMQDVIFAGSDKYSPSPWAEVTLVLDNEGGKSIHIGNSVARPTEIQISRKLYRNGESEYRINGSPARLRDIQEVFMDTGAGAKSYSIIAQGEINRLVQAKPEERRVMIEEVAGITKFKLRRRESLKKIEQTEQNLDRLKDLQNEIEKNLKNLRRQAEKAEEAKALKQRIKKYDLIVSAHQVFDSLKEYRDSKNFIRNTQLELEGWQTRRQALENSLSEERLKKDEFTLKLDEMQDAYNQNSRELAALEERQKYLKKSLAEKELSIQKLEHENIEISRDLETRTERRSVLQNELAKIEGEANDEINFDEVSEQVENLRDQLEIQQSQFEEKLAEIQELESDYSQIDQTIFKNSSRLEEYSTQLQDLTAEIEIVEEQFSGLDKGLSKERELVLELQRMVPELEQKHSSLKESVTNLKSDIKQRESQFREEQRDLLNKEGRLSSLLEIRRSLEGLSQGSAQFLSDRPEAPYARVGQLIECGTEFTQPVQALLEKLFEVLVSTDQGEEIFNWNSQVQKDSWALSVSKSETPKNEKEVKERLLLCDLGRVWSLNEVVKINNPKFQREIESLTSGLFIVENLSPEGTKNLDGNLNIKAIASLDGKVVMVDQGGSRVLQLRSLEDVASGEVARNNEIKFLEELLIEKRVYVSNLEKEIEDLQNSLHQLESTLEHNYQDLSQRKADLASKKAVLESKQKSIEQGQGRLNILRNRKEEVSKKRFELLEQDESLQEKGKYLKDQIADLLGEKSVLQDQLEIIESDYREKLDNYNQKKAFHQSFQSRLKSYQDQLLDIEEQINRLAKRIQDSEANKQNLEIDINSLQDQLNEGDLSCTQRAQDLADEEEALHLLKDQLAELLVGMQSREDEIKKLNQAANKAEKDLAAQMVKIDQYVNNEAQIARDIFEKYQVDLRNVIGRHLEFTEEDFSGLSDNRSMFFQESENGPIEIKSEDFEFVRRYGQDLKDCAIKLKTAKTSLSALGEINWQAIEDYEAQKIRFDFLGAQEEELKKSLVDLQTAIAQIDLKCRLRFQEAFAEVNERFTKVFPIIFGGGSAQLQIVGDMDAPECGIDIIAQPPGKKMQNINLMSGGEKALTAVSLIFSIFLVKPSPFCLLDEVDAPLDDANVGRFNELLREMSHESQFILITHNKKTMELNDTLYGVTMQEPGISTAVSVQLH